jgi:thymidylate synthase
MNKNIKPSAEAKALSLFLMAFKNSKTIYKGQAKRMNKQWERVKNNELSMDEYTEEVKNMLSTFGGYAKVVEETVWFYIKKTGAWTLKGDDKYCKDAQKIADRIMKERSM